MLNDTQMFSNKYFCSAYEALKKKNSDIKEEELIYKSRDTLTSSMLSDFQKEHYSRNGYISGSPPADFYKAKLENCVTEIAEWVESVEQGSTRGISIQGESGIGKTYSSLAAIRKLSEHYTVRLVTDAEAIRREKDYFESRNDMINELRVPYVLVLDDLGKAKISGWSAQFLFEIIDQRLKRNKPTIITTQYTGGELYEKLSRGCDTQTADAILSRLSGFTLIRLKGEDRRRAS